MAIFDYTETYTIPDSAILTTPTDELLWFDVFNPGHNGAGYLTYVSLTFVLSLTGAATFSLQYMEEGTSPESWTTIYTASIGSSTNYTIKEYITAALSAPVYFRIIGTSAAHTIGISALAGTDTIRMIGTVT